MKIGIFGDIHGNRYAFEKIYEHLKKESCDMHLFLGDVCGYYYQQNEIIDILREIPNLRAVAGNHEATFLAALEDAKLLKSYAQNFGRSFELLKENITTANLEFLKSLPAECLMPAYNIAAYHGSPWKPLAEYIYPDSPLERFEELSFTTVFLGHTHYPMDRTWRNTRIINPGSAGQPRNGDWPSYALYNVKTKKAEIKYITYDVASLIRDIENMKENKPYLIEVLQRSAA
ncbi:MAG TPA: metallophosphoesterase family protein [Candidatus Deferrimicrobium sp.]|nr:metallophosphoesterase family protein [Candidatus Deferrimicrobium sp.]